MMKRIIVLALGLTLISFGAAFAKTKKAKKKEPVKKEAVKQEEAVPVQTGNKALVLAFYRDVFNAHNADAINKYCVDRFVDHNPGPGQNPGLDAMKLAFKDYFKAFPDLKVTVVQILEEGDCVIARTMVTGTQKGEFMFFPPSHKSFSIQMIEIIKFKDGKATDRWGNFDTMSMADQLGLKK